MIQLVIPIQTVSEANQREHWAEKNRRKRLQQSAVGWAMLAELGGSTVRYEIQWPMRITLVRVRPKGRRKLDKDNCAGSMKHVQDAIAMQFGIDDGDESKVAWEYDQAIGQGNKYSVIVVLNGIERKAEEKRC